MASKWIYPLATASFNFAVASCVAFVAFVAAVVAASAFDALLFAAVMNSFIFAVNSCTNLSKSALDANNS